MTKDRTRVEDEKRYREREEEAIENGFEQMEMIYKSRCIQMPAGSNVTVREIVKEE